MKTLLLAALLLAPLSTWAISSHEATQLVNRVKARKLSVPFLKVAISPAQPAQGDQPTFFVQPTTTFEGLEILTTATFDGAPITLEHPAPNLWSYSPGALHEIRTHQFAVTVKAQNAQDAEDLRNAIQSIQGEIDALNDQIEAETDPQIRDQLIAQRDQKIQVRDQLQSTLDNLPFSLASETKSLTIAASASGPKVLQVSPNIGGTQSGNLLTITGQGFGFGSQVILGGKSLPILSTSATEIKAIAPDYPEGLKSIEVKFTQSGIKKNAVLENAYYVSESLNGPANAAPTFSSTDVDVVLLTQGAPLRGWLTLIGEPQDTDGTIASCLWNFGGMSVYGDPADFCFANVEFPAPGNYPFSLTIQDNQGATATIQQSRMVLSSALPTGRFTIDPIAGTSPVTIQMDATLSADPDGTPIDLYRWRFPGLPGNILGVTAQREFTESGVRTIRTTQVQFNFAGVQGLNMRKDLRVPVYIDETPPAHGLEPVIQIEAPTSWQTTVGTPITLDAAQSFDAEIGASIAGFEWDASNQSCTTNCTGTNSTFSPTFAQAGHYFPHLKVTDNLGGFSETLAEIHVVNQGLAPRARVSQEAEEGTAPFTVGFDATRSFDFDGFLQSYEFDTGISGDTLRSGAEQSVTYADPGVYFPQFKVIDADGNWSSWVGTVFVNPVTAKTKKSSTKHVKKAKKIAALSDDKEEQRERAKQKRLLTQACSSGQGSACFTLSKLYLEEGNTEGAALLKDRACTLGHQPACGPRSAQ